MGWGRYLLLGDLGQQLDLNEVRDHVERMRDECDRVTWDLRQMKEMAEELAELELRHGLLVRLLIARGVISAEEYAGLITAARAKPAAPENPDRDGGQP
jgi:hypothetical protein